MFIVRTCGTLRLEVTVLDGVDSDEVDLEINRWGYQQSRVIPGSATIVNLGLRSIMEERDASFDYQIFEAEKLILSITGVGDQRTYQGGKVKNAHEGAVKLISF